MCTSYGQFLLCFGRIISSYTFEQLMLLLDCSLDPCKCLINPFSCTPNAFIDCLLKNIFNFKHIGQFSENIIDQSFIELIPNNCHVTDYLCYPRVHNIHNFSI